MSMFSDPSIPQLSDKPLVAVPPRPEHTVRYSASGDGWYILADAYWDAGQRVLDAVEKDGFHTSTMLAPAIFLIRHSVELFLKSQIEDAASMVSYTLDKSEKSAFDAHLLQPLWRLLEKNLRTLGGHKKDAWWRRTSSIITQLDEFDPTSFAFRYPTDKAATKRTHGGSHFELDLQQFRSVLQELHLVLSGTSALLEELKGASPY